MDRIKKAAEIKKMEIEAQKAENSILEILDDLKEKNPDHGRLLVEYVMSFVKLNFRKT
jgi:hypothetical protein